MNQTILPLMVSLLLVGTAHAQSDEENEPRRDRRGPPQEAVEACSTLVQGDPCSFEGRRGNAVEGSCEAPEDKPLACRPEGGPPKRQLERK